ncbi:uncharacterized protein METZ01_LOCUS190137, partial [marine metagenome]
VQDPLQQEVIEHEVRPGNISMGVGWPVKVNLPEEDMEKDYEYQRENFYKLVERG